METVYRSVNPANDRLIEEHQTLSDSDAELALDRAHHAFKLWRNTPVTRRVQLYRQFSEALLIRKDEVAHRITSEMGKPIGQARAEVDLVLSIVDYYANNGERFLADTVIDVPGLEYTVTRREPVGVVLGIEPWNAPLYQAIRTAAPNLMLGNTVLIKPAQQCAGSTRLLDELFREAGFPADVFQTALITHSQVSRYIADDRVRAIGFTGSDYAGKMIGALAGENVKPVTLELGGSDAFLVLDSANAREAAAVASSCRLFISGQVCTSPKRLIVTEQSADVFVAGVVEAFAEQIVGDPTEPSTTVGPLSSVSAAKTVDELVRDAIQKGATVLVPGGLLNEGSAYFAPVVLTDLTPEMRVYHEEVFGPVALIFRVADLKEAVELANSTEYGLGASVFADDLTEAWDAASCLDTGMVGINTFMGGPVEIPFGGTKASGFGRELGPNGMDGFANTKTYGSLFGSQPQAHGDADV